MTDRELLELAAKAAGLSAEWVDFAGMDIRVGYQGGMLCADGDSDYYWNPLKSDGDALRLAVKLRIQITPGTYNEYEATAFRAGAAEAHEKATMGYGIEAATRRAIVRAAAEIGKSM